jgi:hypothetical protein
MHGAFSFDLKENIAETYLVGLGKVVWDIEYQNFNYDTETMLINDGFAILRRGETRSAFIVNDEYLEHDINNKRAVILMIKNKYANRELDPDFILENKEKAAVLLDSLIQSRKRKE